MTTYIVAFDQNQIADYKKLQQGIDTISFSSWIKPTYSQFIMKSSLKSDQIRDALQSYLSPSDQVFIAKIDLSDWASRNINSDLMDALKTKFY